MFKLGRILRSCWEFAQNTSDYIKISTEDARIDTPRLVTLCQNLLDFDRMQPQRVWPVLTDII